MIEDELDAGTIAFAYPLKLATAALMEQMGLTDVEASRYVFEDKETPIEKLGGRTGREFLVKVGTDLGRKFTDQDVWVRRNEQLVGHDNASWVLVDDVRMVNEYNSISRRDGFLIKVINPRVPLAPGITEGNLCGREFDYTIINDGTLAQLRIKTIDVLTRMGVYKDE